MITHEMTADQRNAFAHRFIRMPNYSALESEVSDFLSSYANSENLISI